MVGGLILDQKVSVQIRVGVPKKGIAMKEVKVVKDKETFVYSSKTGANLIFRLSEDGNVVVNFQDLTVIVPRADDDDFASGNQNIIMNSEANTYVSDE